MTPTAELLRRLSTPHQTQQTTKKQAHRKRKKETTFSYPQTRTACG
jgi:hypothetical protein